MTGLILPYPPAAGVVLPPWGKSLFEHTSSTIYPVPFVAHPVQGRSPSPFSCTGFGGGGRRKPRFAGRPKSGFRLPSPCATALFPSPWRKMAAQKYEASSRKQAGLFSTPCLLGKQRQKREAKLCLNILFPLAPLPRFAPSAAGGILRSLRSFPSLSSRTVYENKNFSKFLRGQCERSYNSGQLH